MPPSRHGGTLTPQYWRYLQQRPDLVAAALAELAGRNLACWCSPRHEAGRAFERAEVCDSTTTAHTDNGSPDERSLEGTHSRPNADSLERF